MLRCAFVVGYYLLWCGTVGTVYSHFTYDNIQHYLPFVGYYDSKVCITVSLQVYSNILALNSLMLCYHYCIFVLLVSYQMYSVIIDQ